MNVLSRREMRGTEIGPKLVEVSHIRNVYKKHRRLNKKRPSANTRRIRLI